jgi:hypothetical protein
MTTSRLQATCVAATHNAIPTVWIGAQDGVVAWLGADRPVVFPLFADAPVTCVATAADSSRFIAGSATGDVAVCRAQDGSRIDTFRCAAGVSQAAIIGDRRYITLDDDGQCLVWSPDSSGQLNSLRIGEAGKPPDVWDRFAGGQDNRTLTLSQGLDWSLADLGSGIAGPAVSPAYFDYLAHMDGATGLSKNGALYFIYWDSYQVFDTATQARLWSSRKRFTAWYGAISDDGTRLALGTPEGQVLVLDPGGQPVVTIDASSVQIKKIDISSDGCVVGWIDEQRECGLIDVASGQKLWTAQGMEALFQSAVRIDPGPAPGQP